MLGAASYVVSLLFFTLTLMLFFLYPLFCLPAPALVSPVSVCLSLHDQEVPQRDLELEEVPMELGGEQGRWEEERLKTASLSFGAKRERERGLKEEREKYQLILEEDEMISFVSTAVTMKGTLSEKVGFICSC